LYRSRPLKNRLNKAPRTAIVSKASHDVFSIDLNIVDYLLYNPAYFRWPSSNWETSTSTFWSFDRHFIITSSFGLTFL